MIVRIGKAATIRLGRKRVVARTSVKIRATPTPSPLARSYCPTCVRVR